MEREQIIKALECCSDGRCKNCPNFKITPCQIPLMRDALALIKELTEENEGLEASIKILVANNATLETELAETYDLLEDAKADTVLKMQERLHEHFVHDCGFNYVYLHTIDQIAKEMITNG